MAKAKAKAEPISQYRMPAVAIGDSVMWHDDATADPTAMALVTAVGSESITVAVLGEGYQNFIVRTGVRHIDHPNQELIRATDQGAWSRRPSDLELLDRLADLENKLTDLETELKGPSNGK